MHHEGLKVPNMIILNTNEETQLIEDDDKQRATEARTWRVTSPVTGRKHTGHHGVWRMAYGK